MMWIPIAIAVVILLGAGMLIARRNPQAADAVATAASKAEDAVKSKMGKV